MFEFTFLCQINQNKGSNEKCDRLKIFIDSREARVHLFESRFCCQIDETAGFKRKRSTQDIYRSLARIYFIVIRLRICNAEHYLTTSYKGTHTHTYVNIHFVRRSTKHLGAYCISLMCCCAQYLKFIDNNVFLDLNSLLIT